MSMMAIPSGETGEALLSANLTAAKPVAAADLGRGWYVVHVVHVVQGNSSGLCTCCSSGAWAAAGARSLGGRNNPSGACISDLTSFRGEAGSQIHRGEKSCFSSPVSYSCSV